MNSRCCLGLMTKKHKDPHKNVIDFAISLFFSLLQQEYNKPVGGIKKTA